MAVTFYDEPEDNDRELFWDDLEEWELNQLMLDGYVEDLEDDLDPDLYDQYEYMLDHSEDE